MPLGVSDPVTKTSLNVFAPAPLRMVVPPKVVWAEEVSVPETTTFAMYVASAPAVAERAPGDVMVNTPATEKGTVFAVSEPLAGMVSAAFAINPPLEINDPVTVNRPFVLKAMDEVMLAPGEIVVVKKVVDVGLPVHVLPEPLHVNVPAVKLIVPLLIRFPPIVRATAPLRVEEGLTETLLNVFAPAPNNVDVPLKRIVPPPLVNVPVTVKFPPIPRVVAGAVRVLPVKIVTADKPNVPLLVMVVVPPNVAVPALAVTVAPEDTDKFPFTLKLDEMLTLLEKFRVPNVGAIAPENDVAEG
jgi:hypothetical protein